jgi:hypothetical protein
VPVSSDFLAAFVPTAMVGLVLPMIVAFFHAGTRRFMTGQLDGIDYLLPRTLPQPQPNKAWAALARQRAQRGDAPAASADVTPGPRIGLKITSGGGIGRALPGWC